jgi:hypothetical protein
MNTIESVVEEANRRQVQDASVEIITDSQQPAPILEMDFPPRFQVCENRKPQYISSPVGLMCHDQGFLFCIVTRFAECAELLSVYFFTVIGEVPPRDLSPGTSYAVYLVYKLTSSTSGLRGCVQTASLRLYGERIVPGSTCKVSLDPEARGSASDVTYPVARGDGWLELRLAEFANDEEMLMEKGVIVDLREENVSVQKRGLIVEGMEFRSN